MPEAFHGHRPFRPRQHPAQGISLGLTLAFTTLASVCYYHDYAWWYVGLATFAAVACRAVNWLVSTAESEPSNSVAKYLLRMRYSRATMKSSRSIVVCVGGPSLSPP